MEWTVYDNAGNLRTKSRTFKVDTRDPSVKISGLEPGEEFRTVTRQPSGGPSGTTRGAARRLLKLGLGDGDIAGFVGECSPDSGEAVGLLPGARTALEDHCARVLDRP